MRVIRKKHIHPADGADMLDFYENLPEEGWLEAQEVTVNLKPGDLPGPPVSAVVCESCGEEVTDDRHVIKDGKTLCKTCAGEGYYQ